MSYYYKCYYGTAGTVPTEDSNILWDNSVDGLGIINGTLNLVTNELCHATVKMHGGHPNIDQVTVGTFVKIYRVIDGTETPVFGGFISTIDENIYGTKVAAYTDILALTDYCGVPNPSSGWNRFSTYFSSSFSYYNKYNLLDFTYSIPTESPTGDYVWGDFSSNTIYSAMQAIADNIEKYSYFKMSDKYYSMECKFRADPLQDRKVDFYYGIKGTATKNTQEILLGDNMADITVTRTFPEYTCIYAVDSNGDTFTGNIGLSNYSGSSLCCNTKIINYITQTYSNATSGNLLYFYSQEDANNGKYDIQTSYSITAIDKSVVDSSVVPFDIMKPVRVVSEKHGIDSYAWISEYSIDLIAPSNNKITVGGTQARISK